MHNYLLIIVGPTAIGKTALSIKLAEHFNCDIISCDSRQFFKEMEIGTAVPNKKELTSAKHHFIQNKSIFENYTVGDFEKEVVYKLEVLFKKNNIQIVVGGSGLYVNAILQGFDDFPEIPSAIRENVRKKYEENGLGFLQQKLQKLDKEYYSTLLNKNPQTLQNPQRMMRFVEVCMASGLAYSSFLNQTKNTRNFIPIIIGLESEREIMYNRINLRVKIMMQEGLLAEAKKLHANKTLNALQTVGYKELFDYFDGKTTLDFAVEQIKMNTRRFAKRQLTWFKKNEEIQWFDFETETSNIIQSIENKKALIS
ncbi:tRNA (adenosine(37)-N6)-dimethylallyltransferase MiaA [uncultured Flavobacterium sp.]|uniref:tRNA (adenosine(37)-N6)-dimethylallyltransferase MiaA n=1 Tax=uncultured Flavobacterium sp. TaxID=165435 RepID=UPI0030CA4C05|tara:strand:- start:892 stop:1824 length:933 start_codon:yes stop_codon:yes gene_type:complete